MTTLYVKVITQLYYIGNILVYNLSSWKGQEYIYVYIDKINVKKKYLSLAMWPNYK